MAKHQTDPAPGRQDVREAKPKPTDDIETAQAKSGSVDERVPDRLGLDDAKGVDAPAPAVGLPQSGMGISRGEDELGPGEAVLDKERKELRIPRRPG